MTRLHLRFLRRLRRSRLAQIALIAFFWLVGETLARLSGVPVPGGIVGMAIVLALLGSHRLSLFSMKRGAEWFLAEMLLFFIPAVLALVDHREFIGLLGLKVLLVIVASTAAVMGVTALTVDVFYRWRSKDGSAGSLAG